jgi:DNA repair exonuclease SbcCD nuclease subunit
MRAVVIKDPHLRFGRSRPVGRKASFFGEVRAKLKFIKEYCDENEIGNIILTGDILDQKDPAKYSFNCYRENKEVLIDLISKDSKYTLRRILSVYGNHDIVDGR